MKKLLLTFLLLTFPITAHAESAYDRVIRTGTIRCGYWNWEPLYTVDSNSGARGGIFKDVMDNWSRVTGIKAEWTQEVHFENLVTDLNEGRIDAVCAGVWTSAKRAQFIRFSDPVFYTPMNIYVRAGDARFDGHPEKIDSPDVTAVVMDGEMSTEIRNTDFPRSHVLAIPQIAGSGTELLMNVATGKGDVAFTDAVNGAQFMKNNPGKVQPVKSAVPLRLMPNTIAVAGAEERLQYFLNESLREMHNSGTVDKILDRYDPRYPGVLVRTDKPYRKEK